MKAIKVFIGDSEKLKMLDFVSQMNREQDIVAMIVSHDEFVVATTGECTIAYVKAMICKEFNDYCIDIIK